MVVSPLSSSLFISGKKEEKTKEKKIKKMFTESIRVIQAELKSFGPAHCCPTIRHFSRQWVMCRSVGGLGKK